MCDTVEPLPFQMNC